MIPVTSLWLPILVSAVAVFLASFLVHMVLPYHRSDFAKLPSEDQIAAAIGQAKVPPGDYVFPYGGGPEAMKDPVWQEKVKRGPVGMMTVIPSGELGMGAQLGQWFVFCILVGIFVAYVTGRAVGAGAEYLGVFRFAATTAFLSYGMAQFQDSIWHRRKWSTTFKNLFDALVYALITAGIFGTFWPSA